MPLLEVTLKSSGNKIIPVELNTILIDYDKRKAIFTIVRDITERKKVEQKILRTIIQTEEKERSRLAKELHDGVGPLLSATKIYAKALLNADDEEIQFIISKLNETVDEAILTAQEISNNMSPHVLRNFGLNGAIESFYQKINKTYPTVFYFSSNLKERIDEDIETILYRIMVELIHNTIKHACATEVTIKLLVDADSITLTYADDGKGFDVEKTLEENTGMGLSNIYSRVKSINGKIKIQSIENKGVNIFVKINL
jgi:signal transduction histidine kinase